MTEDEKFDAALDECLKVWNVRSPEPVRRAAREKLKRVTRELEHERALGPLVASVEGFSVEERLRDEFAGRALQGMLSRDQLLSMTPESAAAYSYKFADAMMKAREEV